MTTAPLSVIHLLPTTSSTHWHLSSSTQSGLCNCRHIGRPSAIMSTIRLERRISTVHVHSSFPSGHLCHLFSSALRQQQLFFFFEGHRVVLCEVGACTDEKIGYCDWRRARSWLDGFAAHSLFPFDAVDLSTVHSNQPLFHLSRPSSISSKQNTQPSASPLRHNNNSATIDLHAIDRVTEALRYYSSIFNSLKAAVSGRNQMTTEVYLGRQICNVAASLCIY